MDRIPLSNWAQRAATWAFVIGLGLYGLWSFPLALFGPDRALVPGDLGDARFNNYILEHFHQYASGEVASYWDAPFMYPYKNVIALSDNLLGTAPLYSLFRHAGFNRETAFQFWILAMFALNYCCAFLALNAWSRRPLLAAGGAFIFAFGIHMITHLHHAQVFPRFMVPVAFWFCWQWLQSGRPQHLMAACGAVVFQFYCGIYLGFMLVYALLFLVLAYAFVFRAELWTRRWRAWRPYASIALVLVLAGVALFPLMWPYIRISATTGMRAFAEIIDTLPRPASYFFTHPAALAWHDLSAHSKEAFPNWWNHFHFMGAVPWVALVLLPFLAWRKHFDEVERRKLLVVGLALLLSTLFCLRIGDLTLYKLVFKLPGFAAMRAMDRILAVQTMYFALVPVIVFAHVGRRDWHRLVLAIVLVAVIVVENKVDPKMTKGYDKYTSRSMVDRVALDMARQVTQGTKAVAYAPVRSAMGPHEEHDRTITMHLTAMLAGQQVGIPVVNAYTGSYPGNYMDFWNRLDQPTLDAWCAYNANPSADILLVNNVHQPILTTDTVHLIAANGAYVCLNTMEGDHAIADRPEPLHWETFTRIRISPNHVAFMAHNDRFLSAALHKDGVLAATSDRMGDMAVFKQVDLADGHVALLADNGKYVEWDSTSNRLYARAEDPSPTCYLRMQRALPAEVARF